MTDDRHETGATGEIEGLERKIAELRLARAQMDAERDEHARNAARATTVRDGLHALHHELDVLARERAAAADAAKRERDEAAATLERLARSASEQSRQTADLETQLAAARERGDRIEAERASAESRAAVASQTEMTAREHHDETSRSTADLRAKRDAAATEATHAQARRVQFVDIAQTLDREQSNAEAALATIRARYESTRLQADLDRIKTLEMRLASEREALERRLHDLNGSDGAANGVAPRARTTPHVSLAERLARDFGAGK